MESHKPAGKEQTRVARFSRFEDILAWGKARILTREVYSITRNPLFKRDYALCDQIRRGSLSIMLNIAEGYDRRTDPEFRRYLSIANGSAAEVQSALYVALDQQYLSQPEFQRLYDRCAEIRRMINGLQVYLRQSHSERRRDRRLRTAD
jgi:four helix bundle protein